MCLGWGEGEQTEVFMRDALHGTKRATHLTGAWGCIVTLAMYLTMWTTVPCLIRLTGAVYGLPEAVRVRQ